jgi:hypothetical protein
MREQSLKSKKLRSEHSRRVISGICLARWKRTFKSSVAAISTAEYPAGFRCSEPAKAVSGVLQQEYQSIQTSLGNGDSTATSPDALNTDLLDLRHKLQEARLRYTEDHPDVVQLKDKISKMEKLKQDIDSEITANQQPAKTTSDVDPGAALQVQHGSLLP